MSSWRGGGSVTANRTAVGYEASCEFASEPALSTSRRQQRGYIGPRTCYQRHGLLPKTAIGRAAALGKIAGRDRVFPRLSYTRIDPSMHMLNRSRPAGVVPYCAGGLCFSMQRHHRLLIERGDDWKTGREWLDPRLPQDGRPQGPLSKAVAVM